MSTRPLPIDRQIVAIESGLRGFIEKNDRKIAESERKAAEHAARLLVIEQDLISRRVAGYGSTDKSLGELLTESDNFERVKRGAKETGKIH
jgi:hypothetical protein